MNKRIDNLEFRWSGTNQSHELVQWIKRDGSGDFCIVVAFFRIESEGCDISFVGRRPFDVENNDLVWAMLKYGQSVVDALVILQEET